MARSTRHPAAGRRGLTLIEVALAVSILAIMAALTWGSLARTFDAYETVTDIDRRYHNVRVAMNRMARELSMSFLTAQRRHKGRERMWQTIFRAESGSPFHEVHFTAFAHAILRENAKESDQSEISYFGKSDPEKRDTYNLMRREDPRIDQDPDEGGRVYVLAEDVKDFKLRFWEERKEDWVEEWDTENSEFAGRLPQVVEITLIVADEDGQDLKFVTKTRINLTRELGTI